MHTHQAQHRPDVGSPPAHAVEWRVSCGRRSTRVTAQLWMTARREGAAKLGVMPEACVCKRLDELKLAGKAVA